MLATSVRSVGVGCLLGVSAALFWATTSAFSEESAKPKRPNIVLIVADDLGYGELGCYGGKEIPTPNIDSIATSGVRFTSGYVSCPVCSPTRAGLMTGRYQQRFGHEFNPGPVEDTSDEFGLARTETTLAERLKAAGYATGMVGKWHLGNREGLRPTERGFQEFFGFLAGAHPYTDTRNARRNPILRGTKTIDEKEYLTDAFAREAVAFVDRHKSEPFFLYLPFNAVHAPLQATDKTLEKFASVEDEKRRKFSAMLTSLDSAVGAVLTKLRESSLEENTLVFFISDNGGPTPSTSSRNDPLRGTKATTWEGGIRVPFLVQWKGKIPGGKADDRPVIALDIHPTALAVAGEQIKENDKPFDGVNLLPFLEGTNSGTPHQALFWRFGNQVAVRAGDWKLVKANGAGQRRRNDAGAPNMKGAQLFNLAQDISESKNVAAENPDKVQELAAAWDKWDSELTAPRWRRAAQTKAAKKAKKAAE